MGRYVNLQRTTEWNEKSKIESKNKDQKEKGNVIIIFIL